MKGSFEKQESEPQMKGSCEPQMKVRWRRELVTITMKIRAVDLMMKSNNQEGRIHIPAAELRGGRWWVSAEGVQVLLRPGERP